MMYMLLMSIFYIMLILISVLIIYMINLLFSMLKYNNKEKKSCYECGFNIITKPFIPFSIPFYLMALMFLVFDIEIVLILPIIFFMKYLLIMNVFLMMLSFFFIMIISLCYEWYMNYLKWTF